MAPDLGLGLGFLVGSLVILAAVLYVTRVKRPAVPQARAAGGGDRPAPDTEPCELCERERVCETVADMRVCAECRDDLLA